jgi:NADH dehydrogenase (ubiquinone) Fe-S protein 8
MSRPITSLLTNTLRQHATSSLRPSIVPLPLAYARSFHSSPRRLLATPTTGPQTISSGKPGSIKTPHPIEASTKSAQDEGSRTVSDGSNRASGMSTTSPGAMTYPDYSKGPSALDKASQLFFFTEIVRGECWASAMLHIAMERIDHAAAVRTQRFKGVTACC